MKVAEQPPGPHGQQSDSERRAEELSALYEASRDLSVQADMPALLATLLERMQRLLGCATSTVFLHRAEAGEVEVVASFDSGLPVGTRFGRNQGLTGRVFESGRGLVIEDYQRWEHRIPSLTSTGVRSVLVVPMTSAGEFVGAVGAAEYTTDRVYGEADVRVLSLFATHAGSALRSMELLEEARARQADLIRENEERRRIAEGLRESEARYRMLVELSPDGIGIHRGGEILFLNDAGLRMLGAERPEQVVGQSVIRFLHPDDVPGVLERVRTVIEEQRPVSRAEWRLVRFDGELRDVEAVAMPLAYEGAPAVQVVIRDITDRNRAARALAESEDRFRTLADASFEALIVHDGARILDANRAALEMTGYDYDHIVGIEGLSLLAEESRAVAAEKIRTESTETYEAVALRADGSRYHVELMGRPIPYRGRRCRVTAMRDISERKRAESALRDTEERYRELVENAKDMVFVHDVEGRFLAVNRAAERITGYSRQELLSLSVFDLLAPEEHESVSAAIRGFAAGGEAPDEVIADVLARDGRRVTLEVSPRIVRRDASRVLVEGVARDVTERRRAAEEIRRLNEALERRVEERTAELSAANRELEAFGYSVSHDLRGPLRTIEGFSRLLLDECGASLNETGREYVERVQASSRRMAQLIQDLLSLSRITRNPVQRRRIDLTAIAAAVAADLDASDPQRRVEFAIAEQATADGDPSMLRIVIENLMGNAWKYTSRNATARIEFGFEKRGRERIYFVRDDGVGFDMEFVGKLFRPFERLHRVSEFEGTGIGLALVARVVARHGGKVWAESAVGKGATFYFTLVPGAVA